MAATEEVRLTREVHNNDRGPTYRNDGECRCWRRNLGIVQCHKWGQARLCTGPHALLHLPISDPRCGFPRHGDGVYIQSRQSADLFIESHFIANAKTTRILLRELLFADDSALVAHSAEEMQKIVDAFSNASKKFGLKIIIKKTEVLYQPDSTRTREEDIMVDENKLNSVLEFTYLGSTISSDGCIADEIQGGQG